MFLFPYLPVLFLQYTLKGRKSPSWLVLPVADIVSALSSCVIYFSDFDEYINSPGISIRKIIAQQDIIFSNSMVEAVNKIVKYRSLFLDSIPDINALQKHLEKFVPVYNEMRPHCSLKGLTPSEVLAGLRPDNRGHLKSVNLIGIGEKRILANQHVVTCSECLEK